MDFYEVIKKRRSIRAYQDREVPDDVLRKILEAARLAPSAKNRQPWKFIVVKDETLEKGSRKLPVFSTLSQRLLW